MKKRADDIKKRSNYKNKDSVAAKKTDKEKPAAQKQEASGSKEALQIPAYFWYLGLLAIMLFSIYLRAILPWNAVFTGNNTVMFSSESDAWYHMMLAKSTVMHLERTFYDPLTNFPNGTSIHFGPFISWGIAILSYIAGLGRPSMHTVDVVGAFWPPIMGTLLILPAYFIGKELGGKACGFITALLTVVLPGQLISRTTLGFTDHHSSEILLSALAMLFFLLALGNGRNLSLNTILKGDLKALKYPLLYTVLAGIAMGLYIDAWALGTMFEGILLIAVVIQSIVDHMRGRQTEYLGIIAGGALFIAMLMVLPFANPSNGFGLVQYSLFQPLILLLGVVFALAIAVLSRMLKQMGLSRYYFPGSILAIIIIGFLILNIAAPQFIGSLIAALFSYLLPRTGGAATVAELSPIYANNGIQANFPGLVNLLSPFYLAVVGLAFLAYRYFKKESPADLLVAIWSLFILITTLASNRSAYYFAVNVAILCAFLCIELVRLAKLNDELSIEHVLIGMLLPSILLVILLIMFGSPSAPLLILATIVLPVALMLALFDWLKKPLMKNAEVSLIVVFFFVLLVFSSTILSFAETKYTSGPTSDWYTSCIWLNSSTPNPGMNIYTIYQRPAQGQYPYPDTAYGVMSWWDYGHLMETIGHRMPNANPFQQGIGNATAGIPGSSPYFLAESEEDAERVLANLDKNRSLYMTAKYIMPDGEMAFGKFYAMTAWSKIPFSRYAAAIYQPQGEQLVPIQIYRQSYFKTMVARLQLFDGSETPIGDAVGIAYNYMKLQDGSSVPVITEAPKFSKNYTELQEYVNQSLEKGDRAEIASRDQITPCVPLEALKHYRLVHESEHDYYVQGLKWVKTFEHVPGAVITGVAPAGTKATIAVPVMTNSKRVFFYRQSNVSNGQFILVVPYSTEGPMESGTNFDTKPIGAYQLQIGDNAYEVRVPEEMVMSGGVIKV